jgi:nitrite reductase/ring-hydroxylating ferredoxin subunit
VLEDGQVICLEHLWRWQTSGGQPANPGHPRLRTFRVDQSGALLTLRLQ